jgi:tRNA-modifying protein YgfZ
VDAREEMDNSAILTDRGSVRVSGETARDFLQGLFTCDMANVDPSKPAFGALLTAQGKILFDFFVFEKEGTFLLDCRKDLVGDLVKRLIFYRLRAPVDIEDATDTLEIVAGWGNSSRPEGAHPDPRLDALGWRMISARGTFSAGSSLKDYHVHRIALGVPEGGMDYAYSNTFPHEADMDLLQGVSFSKGCYVGQEVVSRMENRGTARTRIIPVTLAGDAPPPGTEIRAGDRQIGTFGSAANGLGMALVRTDRVSNALADNIPLQAGGVVISPADSQWADFGLTGGK